MWKLAFFPAIRQSDTLWAEKFDSLLFALLHAHERFRARAAFHRFQPARGNPADWQIPACVLCHLRPSGPSSPNFCPSAPRSSSFSLRSCQRSCFTNCPFPSRRFSHRFWAPFYFVAVDFHFRRFHKQYFSLSGSFVTISIRGGIMGQACFPPWPCAEFPATAGGQFLFTTLSGSSCFENIHRRFAWAKSFRFTRCRAWQSLFVPQLCVRLQEYQPYTRYVLWRA